MYMWLDFSKKKEDCGRTEGVSCSVTFCVSNKTPRGFAMSSLLPTRMWHIRKKLKRPKTSDIRKSFLAVGISDLVLNSKLQ